MNPLTRLAAAAALCAALAACPGALPRKADLDHVHDVYRGDFYSTFFVKDTSNFECNRSGDFDKTLEAIRTYEAKYRGENTPEMGHVTVLKGMVHLQAGNFGIARSLKPAVAAAPISASDDREVRDTLFKSAYPGLVDGWQAACESVAPGSVVRDGDFSQPSKPGEKRSEVLARSAKELLEIAKKGGARPGPEADDGAIYLATTAATLRYFRTRMDEDQCRFKADQPGCITAARSSLGADADAIGAFLSPLERALADAAVKTACAGTKPDPTADRWERSVSRGRQRYVVWYIDLKRWSTCP